MMNKQRSFYLAIAAIAVLVVMSLMEIMPTAKSSETQCCFSYDFFVFNTICHAKIWASQAQTNKAADCERKIIARLQELHNAINAFDENSELSRLNHSNENVPFKCSDELWKIVVASREAWQLTDGAFDVTISPLMSVWGFHRKRNEMPSEEEIRQALSRIGFDRLMLDEKNQTVTFSVAGMALDFGGIAKGYALDNIKEILDAAGFDCYLLDFGGNLYVTEYAQDGKVFELGVQHPRSKNKLLTRMKIRNSFIATSGNYERAGKIGEKRIGHIIDPTSGYPVERAESASVITTKGVYSDVLSTAMFVGGPALAEKIVAQLPDTSVVYLAKKDDKIQLFGFPNEKCSICD